jgi:hypothetical protein
MNWGAVQDAVRARRASLQAATGRSVFHSLSIRQPWAWLIVQGHKPIENRTWPTTYRGPLLIHAGVIGATEIHRASTR